MKVFIYYAGFLNTGGPTRRLKMWASQLHKKGWQVTLGGLGRTWRSVKLDIVGVRYERSLYIPSGSRLLRWRLLSAESLCRGLTKHLLKSSYDIVHCVGPSATTYPILCAAKTRGARTILTEAFNGRQPFPAGFDRCWPLLDAIHGPTASVVELVRKRAPTFQGHSFTFASSSDRLLRMLNVQPANKLSIGYVGHLTEHKEVERVLTIWEALIKRLPQAELHIFGEGPLEGKLRQFVDELGLQRSVFFHGYVVNVDEMFSQFSVFINLCEEGHCTAVIEALALGREVFLLARGCFPELYGACEAVHLLPAHSTDKEIVDGLIKVLERENLLSDQVRFSARNHFEKHFTPEVIGTRLAECYATLVTKSSED